MPSSVSLHKSCMHAWAHYVLTLRNSLQNKRAIKRTEDNPGGLISMEVCILLVWLP